MLSNQGIPFNKSKPAKNIVYSKQCIRSCLGINLRHHNSAHTFRKVNWLSAKQRVKQRIAAYIFKSFGED